MWRTAKSRNKRQNSIHSILVESFLFEFMWQQKHQGADFFPARVSEIDGETKKNYEEMTNTVQTPKLWVKFDYFVS